MDRARLIQIAEKVSSLVDQRQKIEAELDALIGGIKKAGSKRVTGPLRKLAAKTRRKANSIGDRVVAFAGSVKTFAIDDAMKAIGWAPADAKRRKHMLVTLSNLKMKKHIKRTGVGRYAAK